MKTLLAGILWLNSGSLDEALDRFALHVRNARTLDRQRAVEADLIAWLEQRVLDDERRVEALWRARNIGGLVELEAAARDAQTRIEMFEAVYGVGGRTFPRLSGFNERRTSVVLRYRELEARAAAMSREIGVRRRQQVEATRIPTVGHAAEASPKGRVATRPDAGASGQEGPEVDGKLGLVPLPIAAWLDEMMPEVVRQAVTFLVAMALLIIGVRVLMWIIGGLRKRRTASATGAQSSGA